LAITLAYSMFAVVAAALRALEDEAVSDTR
jgi:hypothetical protein